MYAYVKAEPVVAARLLEQRESAIDIAERALFDAIERGEQWGIIFYLKNSRNGRERGHNTRVDVAGGRDQPANIVVNVNRIPSPEPRLEPEPADIAFHPADE